ncbi:MAG: WD40 repeat domain-containing protein, partial [Gemmataceae bacterium]
VWDVASGDGRLLGKHEGSVRSVALSADGRVAVSGAEDGTVLVWDVASGDGRPIGSDVRVLDAVHVTSDRFFRPHPDEWSAPLFSLRHGALCLVREADGTRTVGLWGHTDERRCWPMRGPCRAFLIEPEVLARLQDVVKKVCGVEGPEAINLAFEAETLHEHLDLARLVSAIPDLDGEFDGESLRTSRLPVAESFEAFPPRQGELTVVVLVDSTARD